MYVLDRRVTNRFDTYIAGDFKHRFRPGLTWSVSLLQFQWMFRSGFSTIYHRLTFAEGAYGSGDIRV